MACKEEWAEREENIRVPGAGDTGPSYLAPRKDQLGKKRMGPSRTGNQTQSCSRSQHPHVSPGETLLAPHSTQAYVFPILSAPHLCLKYSQPPSCPNSPSLVSPPPRPFPDSLSQSVPSSPMPTTDHDILWSPQAKYRAGKTGVNKWLLDAQPLQASPLRPQKGQDFTQARSPAHSKSSSPSLSLHTKALSSSPPVTAKVLVLGSRLTQNTDAVPRDTP